MYICTYVRKLCDTVHVSYHADCINQFVEIQYNSATSTISCIFLRELDTSKKSCSIRYGVCNQESTEIAADNTTTSNVIMLSLALTSSESQCYVATASNETHTVMFNGRIRIGKPRSYKYIKLNIIAIYPLVF